MQTMSEAQTRVTPREGGVLEGNVAVVLCQALGMSGICTFISPDRTRWTSHKGGRRGAYARHQSGAHDS